MLEAPCVWAKVDGSSWKNAIRKGPGEIGLACIDFVKVCFIVLMQFGRPSGKRACNASFQFGFHSKTAGCHTGSKLCELAKPWVVHQPINHPLMLWLLI